jgi:hypothetical protein
VKSWLNAAHVADAADHAVSGHGLFGHAEVVAVVLRVQSEFHEGAGLEEGLQPFAGAEQALLVAFRELVGSAGVVGNGAPGGEFLEQIR